MVPPLAPATTPDGSAAQPSRNSRSTPPAACGSCGSSTVSAHLLLSPAVAPSSDALSPIQAPSRSIAQILRLGWAWHIGCCLFYLRPGCGGWLPRGPASTGGGNLLQSDDQTQLRGAPGLHRVGSLIPRLPLRWCGQNGCHAKPWSTFVRLGSESGVLIPSDPSLSGDDLGQPGGAGLRQAPLAEAAPLAAPRTPAQAELTTQKRDRTESLNPHAKGNRVVPSRASGWGLSLRRGLAAGLRPLPNRTLGPGALGGLLLAAGLSGPSFCRRPPQASPEHAGQSGKQKQLPQMKSQP